jgi:hypothetical protein
MATGDDRDTQADERQRENMRGGNGPRDEVSGSGVYPASSPDAPADAKVRSEGNLAGHRGGRRRRNEDLDFDDDDSWGSE